MTIELLISKYLSALWIYFQYDIDVYSQKWIYIALLIPAFLYTIFFILKWTILTAPIWLPISLVIKSFFYSLKVFNSSTWKSNYEVIKRQYDNLLIEKAIKDGIEKELTKQKVYKSKTL